MTEEGPCGATVTGIWDALYPDANVIFCHLHSWPGSPWMKTSLMDMAFVQSPAVGFGMDNSCSFAHSSHTIPTETYVLQGLLTKFLLQELKGLQWNLSSLLYFLLLCFTSEARLNIKEQVASKCFLFLGILIFTIRQSWCSSISKENWNNSLFFSHLLSFSRIL